MSSALFIRNTQRIVPLNLRALRQLTRILLRDLLHIDAFDLAVYVVGEARMREVNQQFLRHHGSTDVITFDYAEPAPPGQSRSVGVSDPGLHGEIFICAAEAVSQARRYRTSLEQELVRYLIHGLLHLRGFNDHRPGERRQMKREEDRLLRNLAGLVPLRKLVQRPRTSRLPRPAA